jgi:hypothetical protein
MAIIHIRNLKIVTVKTHIQRSIPFVDKEEYDYHDIINENNALGKRKTVLIDAVLRKRLKHITFSVDTHPKSQIIRGMASRVFFAWISIIVEELFAGNKIHLKKVGTLSLETLPSRASFKGVRKDRYRSRDKGYYTKIRCDYDVPLSKMKYSYPYVSFGKYYKARLHKLEDKGIKY